MIRTTIRLALAVAVLLSATSAVSAQDDDRSLKPAEPEFTVVNLPTSLRLPVWGSAIRITHRFTRPLKCDECSKGFIGSGFGIDDGAVIGLEFRLGVAPGVQVVAHRSRINRAVQFMGEVGLTRQKEGMPLEMAAIVSVEGTDNFDDEFSPAFGMAITRLFGDTAAIHLDPIFVANSQLGSDAGDDSTFALGIGGRVMVAPGLYVVGEVTPKLSGYQPGTALGNFGIEKRLGGHSFQLNFGNDFGTTLRQIAAGAPDGDRWYMGFNLSRKFF